MNSKIEVAEEKTKDEIKTEQQENDDNNNQYKVFYSSYGYIKILKKEIDNNSLTIYNFIQYNNNHSLVGTIFKDNIKENIKIRLKYFYGNRQLITLDNINISSKINILLENFNDDKQINKISKNSQCRLYSCKSGLRELNSNLTFIENKLQDNEIILFFPEPSLSFSQTIKGKAIELSQGYKTAFKINTDDPQYALGNISYHSGRHYFQITLLTDPMIRSIVVGFSVKKDEKVLDVYDKEKFYGFVLSEMKKTTINFLDGGEDLEDYGEVCCINDKIGILYDCKNDGVYISFYLNNKNLGIAFEKLPNDKFYFPTVEMGLCGSKLQITNNIDFPNE